MKTSYITFFGVNSPRALQFCMTKNLVLAIFGRIYQTCGSRVEILY